MQNKLLAPLKIVLGILIFALNHTAYARDYMVELIVFERLDVATENAEVWDFSSNRIADKLQKIRTLKDKSVAYNTLPTLNNLTAINNKLTAAGYRILRSAAWTQPAATYQNAPLISLGITGSSLPDGFVKVYKTSLIFADIDMQYSPTTLAQLSAPNTPSTNSDLNNLPPPSPAAQQPAYFFIAEKRRLKFKEIHYFDHPMFGVIIGVWPSE